MFGPVSGAKISAYAVNSDGSLNASKLLATTTTASDGTYSLPIPNSVIPASAPVGIQMSGGTYAEESTGATVVLTGQTFNSILSSVTPGTKAVAAVNAFTQAAYQSFAKTMAAGLPAGTSPQTAAKNANYTMSAALGVPDILVPPANTAGAIPNDTTGQIATLLAALSASASQASTALGTTVTSADMANAMAKALGASGATIASIGAGSIKVTRPNGSTVTVTPPPMTGTGSLTTLATGVANGTIAMTNYIPPAVLTLPTLTNSPPTTAPVGYVPGALANVPKAPTTAPAPLALPAGSTAAANATPPLVTATSPGSCVFMVTPSPSSAGLAAFEGNCADIYLSGTATQLAQLCAGLPLQLFPGGNLAVTATYKASVACALPTGASRVGTCQSANSGVTTHTYSYVTTASATSPAGLFATSWNTPTSASSHCTNGGGIFTPGI